MPEPVEEYVSILISKNTHRMLREQAELVEPSMAEPTNDAVIYRMLQNNDFLRDGDKVLVFDFKEHCFDIVSINKLQVKKKTKEVKPK